MKTLQLPSHFTPDHPTEGLPNFPAMDFFAAAGTIVLSPFTGKVVKLSGHPPTPSTVPGGPYGWSIYLAVDRPGLIGVAYLTHFGSRFPIVKLGACIGVGEQIGKVADYSKATKGKTPSHIHYGFHKGVWTP